MLGPMRHRVRTLLTAVALSGALLTLAYAAVSNAPPPRGQAADLGLPNFAQVSTNLYRGAQPEEAGFEALALTRASRESGNRLSHKRCDHKYIQRRAQRGAE